MSFMKYKSYRAKVEYSEEDECLIGRVVGIRDIVSVHGDSVEEVRNAFHNAIDDYIDYCKKTGRTPNKPYSGTFNLRVGSKLHQQLDSLAKRDGKSLNQWIVDVLRSLTTKSDVRSSIR